MPIFPFFGFAGIVFFFYVFQEECNRCETGRQKFLAVVFFTVACACFMGIGVLIWGKEMGINDALWAGIVLLFTFFASVMLEWQHDEGPLMLLWFFLVLTAIAIFNYGVFWPVVLMIITALLMRFLGKYAGKKLAKVLSPKKNQAAV